MFDIENLFILFYNPCTLYHSGVLLIQVICAAEMGDVGTKPDIYCTLEADSHGEMSKKTKTKIKKATINPVWEEVCECTFLATDYSIIVCLRVRCLFLCLFVKERSRSSVLIRCYFSDVVYPC